MSRLHSHITGGSEDERPCRLADEPNLRGGEGAYDVRETTERSLGGRRSVDGHPPSRDLLPNRRPGDGGRRDGGGGSISISTLGGGGRERGLVIRSTKRGGGGSELTEIVGGQTLLADRLSYR